MWKEHNRDSKNIRRRWRVRYKKFNRKNNIRFVKLGLMITLIVLLVLLIIGVVFFTKGMVKAEDESAPVGYEILDSVEVMPIISPSPTSEPVIEKKPCVVLDAGHGGIDGGTFHDDIVEKNINAAIVEYIKEYLIENEIDVVLTRTGDQKVALQERTAVANEADATLFVSIHCNYFEDDVRVSGLECYYCPGQEESCLLADTVIDVLSTIDEIKVRSAKEAEYYVLKYTNMPSVLIEVGFLSNKEECEKLNSSDYQKVLAKGLAEAILENLNCERN